MNLFPRSAWAGLSYFAPDRFASLQIRFDQTPPGSEEQKTVRAEAQALIEEFKTFAATVLVMERQSDLVQLCEWQKVKRTLEEHHLLKGCLELIGMDLTMTEMERLLRLHQKTAPPIASLAGALESLENPSRSRR